MQDDSDSTKGAHDATIEDTKRDRATAVADAREQDALHPERHSKVVPVGAQVLLLDQDVVIPLDGSVLGCRLSCSLLLLFLCFCGSLSSQEVQVASC